MSPAPVKLGETRILRVERLAFGGKGVARVDGYTVFVDRGLPGQTVEVKVTRRRKGWSEARILRVVSPGPADVVPRCAHFGLCGGCAFQHLDYPAQLEAKRDQVRECLERWAGSRGEWRPCSLPPPSVPEQDGVLLRRTLAGRTVPVPRRALRSRTPVRRRFGSSSPALSSIRGSRLLAFCGTPPGHRNSTIHQDPRGF
jgi:predicted RNA-binding protein with TRAM domain